MKNLVPLHIFVFPQPIKTLRKINTKFYNFPMKSILDNAMAFSIAAETERDLVSQRTKEALIVRGGDAVGTT